LFFIFIDNPTTFPVANLLAVPRCFLLKATIAKFLSMPTPYNFNEIVGIAAFEKQLLHCINKEGFTRGMRSAYDRSQRRKNPPIAGGPNNHGDALSCAAKIGLA
jgi:hypothetical protein